MAVLCIDTFRLFKSPLVDKVTLPQILYAVGIKTGSSGELGEILTDLSVNNKSSIY